MCFHDQLESEMAEMGREINSDGGPVGKTPEEIAAFVQNTSVLPGNR